MKGLSLHKLGRDREALAFLLEAEELGGLIKDLQRDIQEVERSFASSTKSAPPWSSSIIAVAAA